MRCHPWLLLSIYVSISHRNVDELLFFGSCHQCHFCLCISGKPWYCLLYILWVFCFYFIYVRGTIQWARVYGRLQCTDAVVSAILAEISQECGGVTLHCITSSNTRGEQFLEAAGRNAMLGPEDSVVDETTGIVGATHTADVVRLVTMHVAGLCDDLSHAGQRMDKILTKLIVDENPDVLCFQELTDEMYRVRSVRILNLFSSLERANIPIIPFIPPLDIFQSDPSCKFSFHNHPPSPFPHQTFSPFFYFQSIPPSFSCTPSLHVILSNLFCNISLIRS